MLGHDKEEELLGRHIHEWIHHTRPDGTSYPSEECCMYEALRRSVGAHVDDEVFWRRDGTSFLVEYWSHLMFSEGRNVGAVATFFDITERKQAEEAMRASVDRYRSLVEESPDMIGIYHEGKLVFINSAGTQLLGAKTKDELLGRSGADLIHPDDFEAAGERMRRRLRERPACIRPKSAMCAWTERR